MYYHEKNHQVWLTLTPITKENMLNDTKSFSHSLKMAAITLSNFKWPQLQHFLDDNLYLNTKIISRICSFQNYIISKYPKTS